VTEKDKMHLMNLRKLINWSIKNIVILGKIPKKVLNVYPLFFSLSSLLFFYSRNTLVIGFGDMQRLFFVSTVAFLVIFAVLELLYKDTEKSRFTLMVIVLAFCNFDILKGYIDIFSRIQVLIIVALLVLTCAGVFLIVRREKLLRRVNSFFIAFSVIFFVCSAVYTFKEYLRTVGINDVELAGYPLQITDSKNLPDIYYIILDGYGSKDVLQHFHDFDNSEFVSALEQRGFYVADNSRSNYFQTMFSLSSSLNMQYLNSFREENNDALFLEMVTGSQFEDRVIKMLKKSGYKTVTYISSLFRWLNPVTDFAYKRPLTLNSVEHMYLSGYAPKISLRSYRKDVLYTLGNIGYKEHNLGDPVFVFAHILSPHPPFVFEEDGSMPDKVISPDFSDASDYTGTVEEYSHGYKEQALYLNKKVLEAVDRIIQNSKRPLVIILQGDHGPGSRLDYYFLENSVVEERAGILNAYYFSNGAYDLLYENISPINSFRVIFNTFFGSSYVLLEDKTYYSSHDRSADFIDITDRIRSWGVN